LKRKEEKLNNFDVTEVIPGEVIKENQREEREEEHAEIYTF